MAITERIVSTQLPVFGIRFEQNQRGHRVSQRVRVSRYLLFLIHQCGLLIWAVGGPIFFDQGAPVGA